jgi:phosphocarrier protein
MYTRTTKIVNESGIHARPASDFVQAAGKFKSDIEICRTDNKTFANAKSIIFLLSLGLSQDSEVCIRAEGSDEVQAVDTLINLIESGFGEV